MDRRAFMGSLGAYGSLLAGARGQGTSRAPKLKIREIRAVRMRGCNSRFVRVYTDQGLTGTGETLDTIGAEEIINKWFGPALAGRDPLDIEAIYFDLWSFHSFAPDSTAVFMRGNGGGPYIAAISGIEMALWDLAGKALGLPIYRLMGGRVRDKVAVYFHANNPKTVSDFVHRTGVRGVKTYIDAVAQRGNDASGWDPGKRWNFTLTNRQIDDVVNHVAAMREALGMDFGLMLECHTRFDTESALQLAKLLEPLRPMWMEEPVPPDNVDAMAYVRSHTRIPIACGENVYSRFGYRQYLEKQATSIIQPDMAKCGGLWESRKIAALAEVYHIPIAPHGVATRLGEMAYAHVCCTVPNFMILEWMHYPDETYNSLTTAPDYSDGFLHIPDTPGIGIEINEDAVKALLMPGYAAL
jgi:galactonate dehydratase